jgi:hypothetical protein
MANVGKGLTGAASGAAMGAKLGTIVPGVGNVVGAIGGGLLGGLAGLFGGGKKKPSPEEIAAQELKDAYAGTIVLTPEQRKVRLEMLKDVGRLSPEMEQEILQQDSELKGLKVDPRFKAAQMKALTNLEQQGQQGLTLEDRTALMETQRQAAQQNQGQQEAILQNMEARGMGGSGAELAARLQASQSGADAAAQKGLQIAAQAQRARMDALARAGAAAGQMGQQEFENQGSVASAQDVINRFNTGSRQNVQQRNVQSSNEANKYNLDYQKALESNRVGTTNSQRQSDAQNLQSWASDENARKLGTAGAGTQVAAANTQANQRDAAGFAGTMGALTGVASNLADTKWEMPEWLKDKPKSGGGSQTVGDKFNKIIP